MYQDPAYTLKAPKRWNGRDELEIAPSISNLAEMKSKGAGELNYSWKVSGMATISESGEGRLVLKRAQNSGDLTVELALDNGGAVVITLRPDCSGRTEAGCLGKTHALRR